LSDSVFIKYKITIALVLSGLAHLLIFYVPNPFMADVGEFASASVRVEVELMQPPEPVSRSAPSNKVQPSQDEQLIAVEGEQFTSSAVSQPELSMQPLKDDEKAEITESVVEQAALVHRENRAAGAGREHKQLLQLIYMEINKHKHYPYIAKRQGREGLVRLNFIMHPDGEVTDIAIVETSRFAVLDNAARHAVQAISPFRVAAEYLDSYHRYDVNIDFRLN
jgi:protein TonB